MRTRLRLLLTVLAVLCIVKGALVAVTFLREMYRPSAIVVEITGSRRIIGSSSPVKLKKQVTHLSNVLSVEEQTATPAMRRWIIKFNKRRLTAGRLMNIITGLARQQGYRHDLQVQMVVYIDAPACMNNYKMCPACFTSIPKALDSVKGIRRIRLNKYGKKAYLDFTTDAETPLYAMERALRRDPRKFTVSFTDPIAANQEALLKSNIIDPPCEH